MAIIKWDPFKDLLSMQDRMNRLFDDTLARSRFLDDTMNFAAWSPAVDIMETNNEIHLVAEIPGVTREDISIEIKDNILSISGHRKLENEIKEQNYHRIERSYGKFHRAFSIPGNIKQGDVKAQYKDGLLILTLPKTESHKIKKIEINEE